MAGGVQTGQQDGAVLVLQEAAVVQHDRGAACRARAEHIQANAILELAADGGLFLAAQAAGQQQQAPRALAGLHKKRLGAGHGQIGALPGLRHDRGLERIEQVQGGGQIIGKRHQYMGAAGIDDDAGLRAPPGLQQVAECASCLLQARGRHIRSEHAWRQVEDRHQRLALHGRRLLQALPARPEQRQQGQQPGQAQGKPGQPAALAIAVGQQQGVGGAWQQELPAAAAPLAP